MTDKDNIKSIASLTLIGVVIITFVKYAEKFILQIIQLAALKLDISQEVYNYLFLVPKIIMIGFWAVLVFKYLGEFHGKIELDLLKLKKPAFIIVNFAIVLIVWTVLFQFQVGRQFIVADSALNYLPSGEFLKEKRILLAALGLIEFIIIAIGFIRLFKDNNTTANNG